MAQNEERRARFEQEARSIAVLNHPNRCTLYDVRDYEGRTCLVIKFVEGETLERAIARLDRSGSRTGSGARATVQTRTNGSASGARPGLGRIERILEIGSQIADALEAAHRQGSSIAI